MNCLLSILAILLVLIGVIGCVVPVIPGVILAYVGLVCHYFCSYSTMSSSALYVFALLTLAVSIADYLLPAYMTKLFGGTKAGMRGATAGMVIGIVFCGVVGAIAGPLIGAMAGEMVNDSRNISQALKTGFGSFMSFIVGTGMKLVLSITMLVYIVGDIYPVIRDWLASIF